MGLFNWFKKNKKTEVESENNGQEKFLKDVPTEETVEYSMPEARKPVVVSKESAAKTASKKSVPKAEEKKPAEKEEAVKETKKSAPATAKKAAEKQSAKEAASTAEKKDEPKAEKKPAAKKEAVKAETKTEAKPAPKAAAKKESANTAEPVTEDAEAVSVETTDTVSEGKPTRNGTFDIKKTKDGRYVFNLYSVNRVIIATSQIYSSSQSAKIGVKSVMANAIKSPIEDSTLKNPNPQPFPKWEIYQDKAGEYRFRLYASNGSCVCHAKAGYATKSNCKRGIESIIRLASDAQIDKSYLK